MSDAPHIHKAPALEPVGPNVLAIHPLDGRRAVLVADCSNSLHGREYARLFAASQSMLTALREVLKTPGLQSSVQVLCAAAVAKATGQSIDEVVKGE